MPDINQIQKLINQTKKQLAANKNEEPVVNKDEMSKKWLVILKISRYQKTIKDYDVAELKEHYKEVFDKPCPPATKEWLVEALSREKQRDAYTHTLGEIPKKVLQGDEAFKKRTIPNTIEEVMKKIEKLKENNIITVTY